MQKKTRVRLRVRLRLRVRVLALVLVVVVVMVVVVVVVELVELVVLVVGGGGGGGVVGVVVVVVIVAAAVVVVVIELLQTTATTSTIRTCCYFVTANTANAVFTETTTTASTCCYQNGDCEYSRQHCTISITICIKPSDPLSHGWALARGSRHQALRSILNPKPYARRRSLADSRSDQRPSHHRRSFPSPGRARDRAVWQTLKAPHARDLAMLPAYFGGLAV